jgi:hypothetical protein
LRPNSVKSVPENQAEPAGGAKRGHLHHRLHLRGRRAAPGKINYKGKIFNRVKFFLQLFNSWSAECHLDLDAASNSSNATIIDSNLTFHTVQQTPLDFCATEEIPEVGFYTLNKSLIELCKSKWENI